MKITDMRIRLDLLKDGAFNVEEPGVLLAGDPRSDYTRVRVEGYPFVEKAKALCELLNVFAHDRFPLSFMEEQNHDLAAALIAAQAESQRLRTAGHEMAMVIDQTGHYVADEDTPGFRRCVECDFPSSDSINAWDQHDDGCSIYDRRKAYDAWMEVKGA